MERLVVILAIFGLLAFYWGYLMHRWDRLTADGACGLTLSGLALTIAGVVMVFNLGYILNS